MIRQDDLGPSTWPAVAELVGPQMYSLNGIGLFPNEGLNMFDDESDAAEVLVDLGIVESFVVAQKVVDSLPSHYFS